MADLNPPKEEFKNTLFVKTDISSWDQQAAMFQQAYEWHGRLDFVALNAGMDDRDDIFNTISFDPAKPPKQPNMKTVRLLIVVGQILSLIDLEINQVEVNLVGT